MIAWPFVESRRKINITPPVTHNCDTSGVLLFSDYMNKIFRPRPHFLSASHLYSIRCITDEGKDRARFATEATECTETCRRILFSVSSVASAVTALTAVTAVTAYSRRGQMEDWYHIP